MQWWAQMVPVMKGRGFFSRMTARAWAYLPWRQSSMYSGMSWPMGQPPLQGAVKQSVRGTFSQSFRRGRGLTALTWYLSLRMARASASTFSVSTAVKGSNFNASSFSPICLKRW